MGRALTIFFGLLAFGLLVWVCLGHREGIQKEIADNARAALVADGHGFARASADGQTVVLQGTANTAEQRDAAGRTAAASTTKLHYWPKCRLPDQRPSP